MGRCTVALLGALFCLVTVRTGSASGPRNVDDFPITDNLKATVLGTPDWVRKDFPAIPVKVDRLSVFPERKAPDYLWYESQLRFSYAFQHKPAPLIFLIAGTGGAHNSSKNYALGRAFYNAGFHVVSLSSPTLPNFIVSASSTGVPGNAVLDAQDLYRVMALIRERFADAIDVSGYYLAGYSLGGFNAAFVSWLDDHCGLFGFEKVLLIDPPVRLYDSMSLIDRMLDNIPGGMDNFQRYYDSIVRKLGAVYSTVDRLTFNEDFLYSVAGQLHARDDELAALIGLSFRFAAANMAFSADLVTDFGYIKPANIRLTRNSAPGDYAKVAMRLGFTDYFHSFFYPFYNARLSKSISREDMVRRMSLERIADYLHNSDKVFVMQNRDDPILGDGDIDFTTGVFGDRAKIYPHGGHLGNLQYADNVGYMLRVMTSPSTSRR